jgi:hypothetical protein
VRNYSEDNVEDKMFDKDLKHRPSLQEKDKRMRRIIDNK